jgi:hypothetical protein
MPNAMNQTSIAKTKQTNYIDAKQINQQQNKINKHTLSDNYMLGKKANSKKQMKAPKAVMKKQK